MPNNTSGPAPRQARRTPRNTTTTTTSAETAPRLSGGRILGIIALVVVILLIIAVVVFRPWSTKDGAQTQVTPTPSASAPATLQEANDAVTVADGVLDWKYPVRYSLLVKSFGYKTVTVDNSTKDVIPVFEIGSLLPVGTDLGKRLTSDSVNVPLPEHTVEAIIARILAEPDYAAMVCSGLYGTVFHTVLGDVSLAANNPWLKGCASVTKINGWAGTASNAVQGQADHVQYTKSAALVAELVERMTLLGTGERTTFSNYHLAVTGPNNVIMVNPKAPEATISEFELNPFQYTGQFIFLGIGIKGVEPGCDPIGFNIGSNGLVNADGNGGDGRFARFACPLTTPTPPTPSTPPTSDCVYGLNPDRECIPSKPNDLAQTHPDGIQPAPVTPVQPVQPPVAVEPPVVVVPQPNQGGGGTVEVQG
ncbi:hypothetical protein BH10PAT4_BH10PAT4_2820 [soil metagenome]